MIKQGYILIILFTIAVNMAFGQSSLTYDAYEYYTNGEYKKAAELMDKAVVETDDSTYVESWQLRATTYWNIYQKIDKKSPLSDARVVSLISILKAVELDTDKKFFQENIKLLDWISTSYYNDAVNATNALNPNDPKYAENSYFEFKRIQKIAYPNKDFSETDIKFYKAEATSFAKYYQTNVENKDFYHLTLEALDKVLKIDSNDYGANYNTAIYYYNEGVMQIEAMSTELDIPTIMLIQKFSEEKFKQALPYMLKANKIRTREETLKGLKGIYNALWDEEMFEYYSKELERFRENNPGE